MNKTNGNLTQYKVQELQEDVKALQNDVTKIMTNHIPHLSEDIISLKTRIMVLTAINIGAIILGIVVARVFK